MEVALSRAQIRCVGCGGGQAVGVVASPSDPHYSSSCSCLHRAQLQARLILWLLALARSLVLPGRGGRKLWLHHERGVGR